MLNMYTQTLGGNALCQTKTVSRVCTYSKEEGKCFSGCFNIGLQVHVLQWLDIIVRDDNTMPLTTAC